MKISTKKYDENNQNFRNKGINTKLSHMSHNQFSYNAFINPPLIRASTILFPDSKTFESEDQPYTYGTNGTPTTDALCAMVDVLEGAAKTLLTPSGLTAITVSLLSAVKSGDHILLTDSIYHPTRRFADTMLTRLGISVEYYDSRLGAAIETLIRPNTRVIFTESPASNTLELQDIPAISAVAHRHNILVIMDNTWATPLYFKPLAHGVDISIHAATKYPSGHSDLLMGFISVNERAKAMLTKTYKDLGICVSGDDAYLMLRSIRTMGLRLKQQQETTLKLAQWLETMPQVERVFYPALPSHPDYDIWKRDFKGASSLFSFRLKGDKKSKAHKFIDSLELFGIGYSWGGYKSLAVPVALNDRTLDSNRGMFIRLHIGIEDFDDLQEDLNNALKACSL
ncbi:cystathionine beta-lyase [Bartonella sp. DGB2]|uniref:cystathionine beta-lyase n=1 Tax=Bartonella sp. DGB2 TaxID=3388426 RepID=UPI00398FA7B8